MKLRREAMVLKRKALASLRRSTSAFNSYDEDGRTTSVLLHMQHSFEMLLKAGLVQRRVRVFDPKAGASIGFEKAVNLSQEHLKLTEPEAGLCRAINTMRDQEQHWFATVSEELLYTHVQAGVTLFDDLLHRVFKQRLADVLPSRVLPVSSQPPRDIQLLIDEEYKQIRSLLQPGKRRRPEARGRIRTLLAMEAHVADQVLVSKKDVDRVERAIRTGKQRKTVFPRLERMSAEVTGEGLSVVVRLSKTEGLPVRVVSADDPTQAAAIREVDLQNKFHWSGSQLAAKLKLTAPRCLALRRRLKIDGDPACRHDFKFGSVVHPRYSDNAYTKMREALETIDMDEVWRMHRARSRRRLGT